MIPWASCVLWLGYPILNGVWPDISKNDNDGAITGAFWGGDSMVFDGIDDYVNCGNPSSLNVAGAITVEAMIRSVNRVGNDWVCAKGYLAGMMPFALGLHARNYVSFSRYSGGWVEAISTTVVGSTDVWFHTVGVYDGTYYRIYVNGVNEHSIVGSRVNNNEYTYIGCRSTPAPTDFFNGDIALVRIYDKALTTQQIQESYEQCYRMV